MHRRLRCRESSGARREGVHADRWEHRRSRPEQDRSDVADEFVDQSRPDEGAGDARAALHEDVPDAACMQVRQRGPDVAGAQLDEAGAADGGVRRNVAQTHHGAQRPGLQRFGGRAFGGGAGFLPDAASVPRGAVAGSGSGT
jgi:hypothetical protein